MLSFAEILGQDEAITELRTGLARDRIHHAYLFEGRAGSGRITLARAFAAIVLCAPEASSPRPAGPGEGKPDRCGKCQSCRLLDQGNHPDYLELPRATPFLRKGRFVHDAASKEKLDHPLVLNFLRLKPALAERRVAVIPGAERLTEDAANTFLKTLEEPPGNALIVLTTTARDRLLATIVSRCRRIRVRPLPLERLATELLRQGVSTAAEARELAELAEGSLGAALQLAAGQALEDWRWVEQALATPTPAGAVALARGLIERAGAGGTDSQARRQQGVLLLDLLAQCLRRRLRHGLSPRAAARALAALWQASEQLAANVRLELVLHAASLETMAALRRG